VRTRTRYVIDVLPLGAVGDVDWIRLRATAKFLRLYYGVPVRLLGPVPLAGLPAEASRSGPGGERQYAAPYLLERVIRPRLRRDTMACLAMTNVDLVPGPGWGRIKYLYGFAAVDARVAIASAYRCRSAEQDRRGRREELRRILKTAAHEVGHVLRIPHCTSWACNMNGQNSRFEMDRRPLWLCPDCAAKIAWASQIEPAERYRRLEAFCRDHDLEEEAAFYRRSREALEFRLARRDGSRPVASRERAARPTLLERVGESLLGWR
jgi:archaemetzincin